LRAAISDGLHVILAEAHQDRSAVPAIEKASGLGQKAGAKLQQLKERFFGHERASE
jgi:hypothetical protein